MLPSPVIGGLGGSFTVESSLGTPVSVTGLRQLKSIETVRPILSTSVQRPREPGRVYGKRCRTASSLVRVGSPTPLTKSTRSPFSQPQLGGLASVSLVAIARGRVPSTFLGPLGSTFCEP